MFAFSVRFGEVGLKSPPKPGTSLDSNIPSRKSVPKSADSAPMPEVSSRSE